MNLLRSVPTKLMAQIETTWDWHRLPVIGLDQVQAPGPVPTSHSLLPTHSPTHQMLFPCPQMPPTHLLPTLSKPPRSSTNLPLPSACGNVGRQAYIYSLAYLPMSGVKVLLWHFSACTSQKGTLDCALVYFQVCIWLFPWTAHIILI